MSPIYEISLCLIVEADNPDEAVDNMMVEYDLGRHFEVTDVTEEYADSFKPLEEQ